MRLQRGLQRVALTSGTAASVFCGITYLFGDGANDTEEAPRRMMKEAVWMWTEKSAEVTQAAASLVGTLKDTALAILHGRGTASGEDLIESFINRVEAWSSDTAKRKALVVVGGNVLPGWLLKKAGGSPSPDQATAENAICNLLSDETTAAVVLQLDGGVPRLLKLLENSEDADRLAASLSLASSRACMPRNASLDELLDTIDMMGFQYEPATRLAAIRFLCGWGEASVLNCGKMASLRIGPAITQTLADTTRSMGADAFYEAATRLMAVLARDSPLRKVLGTDAWVQQLLFVAADAAADRNDRLVVLALDALSACLEHGEDLSAVVQRSNVWSLLRSLADSSNEDLRRAICLTVATLSKCGLAENERQHWVSLLLSWIRADHGFGPAEDVGNAHTAVALGALAAAGGCSGLGVAGAWLGDMLILLSRNAKTYSSIRVGGRDMKEEVSQDHVPVVPVFARSVAHDLRAALDGQAAPFLEELPIDIEAAVRAERSASRDRLEPEEARLADSQLCRSLRVLCALISSDDAKQRWLQSAGITDLLQRLILDTHEDLVAGVPRMAPSLDTQRQCARLLAMIAASGDTSQLRRHHRWVDWLREAGKSDDCKLSSHANRTLLHLQSAQAVGPLHNREDAFGLLENGEDLLGSEKDEKLQREDRVVFRDGVHLFCPRALHHTALAREGAGSKHDGAPLLDVIFVHGIRGGPFASWRVNRLPAGGKAFLTPTHDTCWPSHWLSRDVPEARLLSLEYAAPASGWEGESLPLRGTVGQLMDKLAAAGVGRRPCIFVCHSMGGILTKEIIAKALTSSPEDRRSSLAASTVGLVFYACPHQGSWLADIGWTLRFVGASPAASVLHLRPGKHLEDVNEAISQLHAEKDIQVLSFCEGAPTGVMMGLPQLLVVPSTSAFPGYGRFVTLPGVDHIDTCKPVDRADPAYAETLALVQTLAAALRDGTEREQRPVSSE